MNESVGNSMSDALALWLEASATAAAAYAAAVAAIDAASEASASAEFAAAAADDRLWATSVLSAAEAAQLAAE